MSKITIANCGPYDEVISASKATPGDYFFCLYCGKQLRVHKRRSPHGNADHFEHITKGNCPRLTQRDSD